MKSSGFFFAFLCLIGGEKKKKKLFDLFFFFLFLFHFDLVYKFSWTPPSRSAPVLDDPHAPPLGPVVPLERDATGDEGEESVIPALKLSFFSKVF